MQRIVHPLLLAALLLSALPAPPADAASAAAARSAKAKKAKTTKTVRKKAAVLDESTTPTRPKRKITAVEKIQFRDAILAGLRGRHTPEPAIAEKLADDLAEYYATGQMTADEVNRVRDAMRGFLDTERPSHGDLDGLAGLVNAVTESSNLDIADMDALAADVRAVAESIRVETPTAATKTETKAKGERRRRGLFRRLFR